MKKLIICSLLFSFGFLINSFTAQCVEGNCINGKGVYIVDNEIIYTGYFRNGDPSGRGILHYRDGSRLYARWYNGLPEGKSIYVDPEGYKLYHIVKSNEIQGVSIIKDPRGVMTGGLLWRDGEVIDFIAPKAQSSDVREYIHL